MPNFVIARFADVDVVAGGWWAPRAGQRVWLAVEHDPWDGRRRLVVSATPEHGAGIPYTWPRGKSLQDAGRLAYRHVQRRAGQAAGAGTAA